MRRSLTVLTPLVVVALLAGATPAAAQPPAPPPNPSEQELRAGQDSVAQRAAEVGRLSTQAYELDRRAIAVRAELATKRESAFQELLELQSAQEAADDASRVLDKARIEIIAADTARERAQDRVDAFATTNYQQNLDLGPLGLLTTAISPSDVVAKAEFTDLLATEQRRALDALGRASIDKINSESTAQATQEEAQNRREAAERSRADADRAVTAATTAVTEQEVQLRALTDQSVALERQLEAAQDAYNGLRTQRDRFVDYQRRAAEEEAQARRRAAQAAAADAAAEAAAATAANAEAPGPTPEPPRGPQPPRPERRRDVDRAAAQLGPQYECRGKVPRWGPVKPWVSEAGQLLRCRFGISSVGGVGSRPNPSDHPAGLALDFFVDRSTGDALAECALRNRNRLAVKYVIFRQRINSGSGWRPMEDRGSPVANHMEHVHMSFLAAPGSVTSAVDC